MIVHIIKNSVLHSCSYILSCCNNNDAYLIDCGDIDPILNYVKNNNLKLKGIFLTHGHYDHIYGIKQLLYIYKSLIIYGTSDAIDALSEPDKNLSYLYDIDEEYEIDPIFIIRNNLMDKDSFQILNTQVSCLYTPGHDVDCMSYVIGNNLFTGDSYNPDFDVFAKWSSSNLKEAEKNERLLKELVIEHNLKIYPGHYK